MPARCSLLLPLAASLAFCSCGGNVVVDPPALEAAGFAAAYAHAYCSTFGGCCAGMGRAPASGCEPEIASKIQADVDGSTSAGAVFDSDAARRCIEALEATACLTVKTAWLVVPDACEQIFKHKPTATGSLCSSRWECADAPPAQGRCEPFTAKGDSKCVLSTQVDPGASCLPTMPAPNEYLSCRFCESETGICWALGELGEPCVTGQNWGDTCVPGALCDRVHTKTCVKPKAVGEACDSVEECEGLACEEGHCQPILWAPDAACTPP